MCVKLFCRLYLAPQAYIEKLEIYLTSITFLYQQKQLTCSCDKQIHLQQRHELMASQ